MKPSTSKWFICGLLFLATVLNYLDRQTVSVSASKIAEELHLNDSQLGQLFFAFFFANALGQLFIGPVLDRLGVVLSFAVAVVAWSLAGASAALTAGFATLFATRVALGVCESPNWLLALRVVTRILPPSQRSLANGIFQSGTSIGGLVGAAHHRLAHAHLQLASQLRRCRRGRPGVVDPLAGLVPSVAGAGNGERRADGGRSPAGRLPCRWRAAGSHGRCNGGRKTDRRRRNRPHPRSGGS